MNFSDSDVRRFLAKVDVDPVSGCWNWTSAIKNKGYGGFRFPDRYVRAHRVAFEMFRGPIPEGMTITQTCSNRLCVCPDHLEPSTTIDNLRRAFPHSKSNSDVCLHGHSWVEENIYRKPGVPTAICRQCVRDSKRRSARRRREASV